MADARRTQLEDELASAQVQADDAVYLLEMATAGVLTRQKALAASPSPKAAPLRTELERLIDRSRTQTAQWVKVSSYDLYGSTNAALISALSPLQSVTSEMAALTSEVDDFSQRSASLVKDLEKELQRSRETATEALEEARRTVSTVRSSGLVPSEAEELLVSAEQALQSADPQDLIKATQYADSAAKSALSLEDARTALRNRLSSTSTRLAAARTRSSDLDASLKTLRRSHPQSAWSDVDVTEKEAADLLAAVEPGMAEVASLLERGDVAAASSALDSVRKQLVTAEARATAPVNRLRELKDLERGSSDRLVAARRVLRDAQRLCVNMGTPRNEANRLDAVAAQLDVVESSTRSKYPDWRRFDTDVDAATDQVTSVVQRLRSLPR